MVNYAFRLLWPWPLTAKYNQHSYELKHICDQNWLKFPSPRWLRYGVHKVFGTHRLTHSRTDRPDYKMPPPSFFTGGGGTRLKKTWNKTATQRKCSNEHYLPWSHIDVIVWLGLQCVGCWRDVIALLLLLFLGSARQLWRQRAWQRPAAALRLYQREQVCASSPSAVYQSVSAANFSLVPQKTWPTSDGLCRQTDNRLMERFCLCFNFDRTIRRTSEKHIGLYTDNARHWFL